ncbi:MAG: ABC transporter permease [Arcanobacterium sp.]|nr:ABC transporter permease [Arcanobacterium sp.]
MKKQVTPDGLTVPGRSTGLIGALANTYLLNLIVRKELRVRYRGSALGMLWSYAKPAVQFLVFFFAIGVFMGMNRNIENYVVYMFSGVIVINYFSEIFGNATRILIGNKDLVKKIYLQRELFPLSSVVVAFVHFVPQVVILVIGALIFGWRPGVMNLAAFLLGLVIITVFGLGLGLFAGALNVMYRDAENFVDLLLMMVTWTSPVLYMWTMVREVLSGSWEWLWYVYMLNPISAVVELFHKAFWEPTRGVDSTLMLPSLWSWAGIGLLMSCVVLFIGDRTFKHYDGRFAQEL